MAKNKKWFFNGKLIETVNSYKYLGVTFQAIGGFSTHFENRTKLAKIGLNSIWKFVTRNLTDIQPKFKVFDSAVHKAIALYGTQSIRLHFK